MTSNLCQMCYCRDTGSMKYVSPDGSIESIVLPVLKSIPGPSGPAGRDGRPGRDGINGLAFDVQAALAAIPAAASVMSAAQSAANAVQAFGTPRSFAYNDYIIWPNGLIEQWMLVTPASTVSIVNYPIPFPAKGINMQVTPTATNSCSLVYNSASQATLTVSVINSPVFIRIIGY